MKYGLLVDFGAPYCNYGDYAQSIAIEYLYGIMGIPENEIIQISTKELATYDGEQLLLPYSYVLHFLVSPEDGRVALSDKITPVFLGASVEFAMLLNSYSLDNFFSPEKGWSEMFRKFAPIGCRDEFTYKFITQLGIPAYLQGCITNILPHRRDGIYKKVLLIDCPSEVLPYIPNELLANAEVMSNAEYIGNLSIQDNYIKIKQRYEYYRDNAALVVTTRFHVATPCNAMGIPAIFTMRPFDKHSEDIRLDTLNPFIQLCSSENYSYINWYPKWQDFRELKSSITQMAIARIQEAYERYTRSAQIREFFRTRINEYDGIKSTEYVYKTRLHNFIQNYYARPVCGHFYIWGAIQLLCDGNNVILANLVNENNPNLDFVGWIDTFKSGMLANKPILKPEEFSLDENEFVIVASETAVPDALARFRKMQINEKQFLIISNTMIEEADLKKVLAQKEE